MQTRRKKKVQQYSISLILMRKCLHNMTTTARLLEAALVNGHSASRRGRMTFGRTHIAVYLTFDPCKMRLTCDQGRRPRAVDEAVPMRGRYPIRGAG